MKKKVLPLVVHYHYRQQTRLSTGDEQSHPKEMEYVQ